MSNDDEIDAGPPPAVSSLRNRFEQLAAHSNEQSQPVPSGSRSRPTSYIRSTTPVPRAPTPTPTPPTPTSAPQQPHSAPGHSTHLSTDQGNNNNLDFLHPYHARAGSTVSLTSSNGELLPPPLPSRGRAGSDVSSTASDDVHHLRNASSSGDLKRRPPPPPPVGRSRSPGTSPMMRAERDGGSIGRKGALPLPEGYSLDGEEHLSVKDMRNRFNGQSSSPAPSSPETSTKRKPPPPPGPPLTPSSSNPSLRSPSPLNGNGVASPFNNTPTQSPAQVTSPFGSPPPVVPARKVQGPPLPRRSQGSGSELGNILGFENGGGSKYGSEDETVFTSPVKVYGGTAAGGGPRPAPGSLSSFDSSSSSDSIPHVTATAGRDYNPTPPPPPRLDKRPPPPRHASLASTHSTHSSSSINSVASEAPALPARRSTADDHAPRDTFVPSPPPKRTVPPPVHHHPLHPHPPTQPLAAQAPVHTSVHVAPPPGPTPAPVPPLAANKAIKHQPPPTRTIGLHEPLPELRRSQGRTTVGSTLSSEDSEDESGDEELKDPRLMQAPDTSRASRRRPVAHPHAFSPKAINVQYNGPLAVAGSLHAVAGQHHVRIFDLDVQEGPWYTLDGRDVGLAGRALVSTSLCWSGRGKGKRWLWIGTKDGHLFEFDVQLGAVAGQKLAAHSSGVMHILRHGASMATVDDGGKMLVFESDVGSAESEAGLLARTAPRVCRIAEKQSFVKIFGGRLWTSFKDKEVDKDARGPVVRIYDVFTGGNPGAPPRSVLPSEPLGAVVSGGIVPSEPDRVFLGHEGGCVSVWKTDGGAGSLPECIDVVKIGASDVVALEGVHDKLWTSGRGGRINAYDVSQRPWVQTASWSGHYDLPISRLVLDVVGVGEGRGMKVISVGRNDKMEFWDGLLGADWLDMELLKREAEFASFRDLEVLIVTWNVDANRPMDLQSPTSVNFLHDLLTSAPNKPDIISFGFQETIPLESKSSAMRQLLRSSGTVSSDGRKTVRYGADAALCSTKDEKASRAYRQWYDALQKAVRLAYDATDPYVVVHTENLVGLFSCVLVRQTLRTSIRDVGVSTVKRGAGGRYGNKGGIICRMTIDDTSIALVNAHIAAGQTKVRSRNADLTAIIEGKALFHESEDEVEHDGITYIGGGDGSTLLDHEIVFFNGDLNYRVDARRDAIVAAVDKGEFLNFLQHDQLSKEMRFNRGFRLRGFLEGDITFPPTYKYDPHTNQYDTSSKRRSPAWCDRILWRAMSPDRVRLRQYKRYEVDVSDHRPVSAAFRTTVKSVRQDARAGVKGQMVGVWRSRERELVELARGFYVDVGALVE